MQKLDCRELINDIQIIETLNVEYSLKLGCGGKEIEWTDNCRSLKTEKIKGKYGIGTRGKMDNSFYVRAGSVSFH